MPTKFVFTSDEPYAIGGFVCYISSPHDLKPFDSVGPSSIKNKLLTDPKFGEDLTLHGFIPSYEDDRIQITPIPMNTTVSYTITIKQQLTSFKKEVASKFGLETKQIGLLKKMGELTLEDGTKITTDMVFSESPLIKILILDLTTLDDLEKLPSDLSDISAFIHFTNTDIVKRFEYYSKFSTQKLNICFFMNGQITLYKTCSIYKKYINTAPNIFQNLSCGETPTQSMLPPSFINGEPNQQFSYGKGKFELLNPKCIDTIPTYEPILPTFDSFAVTFLGTGAGFANSPRSLSSYLIHTKNGYIILDAGDGCYEQINRKYGPTNTQMILKNLLCIWISHHHTDHICGLPMLLNERSKITNSVIPLCCDIDLWNVISKIEKLKSPPGWNIQFYDRIEPILLEGTKIVSIPSLHIEYSMGCILEIDQSYKIVYSGDQFTSCDFTSHIHSCDLLIHESTFLDNSIELSENFGHSTYDMAIKASKQMNAHYTCLSHISIRYTIDQAVTDEPNTCFVSDYLELNFDHIEDFIHAVKSTKFYQK